MTLEQALARMRLRCQSTSEPTLSDAELTAILEIYQLEDENGLAPGDASWIGTYALSDAYREGWLIKAGKVVSDVNYAVDGAQYSQSDMHEHCLKMADRFQTEGGISLGGTLV